MTSYAQDDCLYKCLAEWLHDCPVYLSVGGPLKNFCKKICKCKSSWTTKNKINEIIHYVQDTVKNERVLLALSGGVDSTVVAALLKKAIGKNLYCMFIDTGLLRKNEVHDVENNIKKNLKINLITINAQKIFLSKLKGIIDPERKRKSRGCINGRYWRRNNRFNVF